MSRDSKLAEAMRASAEKSRKAREKAREKARNKNSWKNVHACWIDEFTEKFGEPPSKWGAKDIVVAKSVVSEFSREDSSAMIHEFISRWEKRPFEGAPTIRLMWAIRDTMLREIRGDANASKRSKLLVDEFTKSDDPEEGW